MGKKTLTPARSLGIRIRFASPIALSIQHLRYPPFLARFMLISNCPLEGSGHSAAYPVRKQELNMKKFSLGLALILVAVAFATAQTASGQTAQGGPMPPV